MKTWDSRAFVMLGAGVQSTVVAALAAERDERLLEAMGNLPEAAIFADTGWERAETYAFLERFRAWCADRGFPVHVVSSGNLRADGLAAAVNGTRWDQLPAWVGGDAGGPAPLRRTCTRYYKVEPINRFLREQLAISRSKGIVYAEKWFGISLEEARRVKDSLLAWALHRYPLLDLRWHQQKCYLELERLGLGIPPKSACLGCPYRSDGFGSECEGLCGT